MGIIKQDELHGLTSLRGVAALGVVLFHYADEFPALADYTFWTRHYYIWVDLFFILSGFILMHVYAEEFVRFTKIKYKGFLVKRLARIYPLHLVTLLVMIGLEGILLLGENKGWLMPSHPPFEIEAFSTWAILTNLFLVQSWGIHSMLTWNGPAWSISCEWLMYMLFPALIVCVRTVRNAVVVLSCSMVGYLFLYYGLKNGTLDIHYDLGVLRALAGFLAGMALHRIYKSHKVGCVWLYLSCAWIVVCSLAVLPDWYYLPAFAMLVFVIACRSKQAPKTMLGRGTLALGEISYSIYLWHIPFWLVVAQAYKVLFKDDLGGGGILASIAWLLAAIIGLIGVSFISYLVIEKPARKYLKRFA